MKKQYTTPEMKVVNLNPTDIICTSVSFGGGSTNSMNSRDSFFDENDDDEWAF